MSGSRDFLRAYAISLQSARSAGLFAFSNPPLRVITLPPSFTICINESGAGNNKKKMGPP